jgi:hypothetical protein
VNQQELRSQSSLLSWDIMAKEGLLMVCPGYGLDTLKEPSGFPFALMRG